MGDVLLALPAFAAIRTKYRSAKLTLISGLAAAEVARMSNLFDEVIEVDRVELRDGPKLRSIKEILKIVKDVRRRRFDMVIDLNSLYETNLLGYLSGAATRLYSHRPRRSLDILSTLVPPREDRSLHHSQMYMQVLRPLEIESDPLPFRIEISPEELKAARKKAKVNEKSGKEIAIFPGAGHPSRCWPLDHFAEIAERSLNFGAMVYVILGPEEAADIDRYAKAFSSRVKMVKGLSVREFTAFTATLDAFLTNDTGPMHLAALTSTPIIVVMDKMAPLRYLPIAESVTVINNAGISDIDANSVFDALMTLIADKIH